MLKPTLSLLGSSLTLHVSPVLRVTQRLSSPGAIGPQRSEASTLPLQWTLPPGWPQASLSHIAATASYQEPGDSPFYSARLASTAHQAMTSALVSKRAGCIPHPSVTQGLPLYLVASPLIVRVTSLAGAVSRGLWGGQHLDCFQRSQDSLLLLLLMIDCCQMEKSDFERTSRLNM